MNLNRLMARSRAFQGGGRPIIKQNAWKETVYMGGVLSGGLKRGDVIFSGDFAYYDYKNRKVYPLRQLILAQDLGATDTVAYFLRTDYTHTLRTGLFIMAEPETSTSKGKAVSCDVVENTTLNGTAVYALTITAGALGTGKAGDVYVEAKSAGTEVEPLITEINVILEDGLLIENDMSDVMEDTYNHVGTISPLMHCTLIAGLVSVPKIAPESKCAIKEFYQL